MATAQQVLNIARGELGYRESPAGSNKTKYGRWFGRDGNAWCDMFVSWVAYKAGASAIIGKQSYTPAHAEWFQKRGRWGHTPRVGAIVFFKFPEMGRICHVGIVEAVRSDGSIVTIEGNTNDAGSRTGGMVMRKVRRANIAGYGYPAYSTPHAAPAPAKTTARKHPTLRRGDKGRSVVELQNKLNAKSIRPKLKADGNFGSATERNLKAFQKAHHLHVDGVAGPDTWKVLDA